MRILINQKGLPSLLRNLSVSFVIVILGTSTGFVLRFVLLRTMNIEEYGNYTYVIAWLSILSVVCLGGWDTTSTRFMASYREQSRNTLLTMFWDHSNRKVLINTICILSVVIIVVFIAQDYISEGLTHTFWLMCLALPFFTFMILYTKVLLAFDNVLLGVGPTTLFIKIFLIVSIIGIFLVTHNKLAASIVLAIHLVIVLGILTLLLRQIFKSINRNITEEFNKSEAIFEWNHTASGLNVLAILGIISRRIDIILLGVFLGTTQSGIYSTALVISGLTGFGLQSLNYVLAPAIARLYDQRKWTELQRLLSVSALLLFLYVLIINTIIILAGKEILRLFDSALVSGYGALIILTLGQSINSIFGSVNSLLKMTGKQKIASQILVFTTIVSFFSSVILIPTFGLIGAAVTNTIVSISWNLIMYLYVLRKLNLDPSIFSVIRFVVRRRGIND